MAHWLMKTEPDTFGIADLAQRGTEPWTGVRNYMARNIMRQMVVGDDVLFYHSSCEPPGVAGLARVSKTAVIDETQFDPASKYFEPRATRVAPVWDCVEVAYVETLPRLVAIGELRADPPLADMMLLRRGMRLSVQPVTAAEYARIVELARQPAPVAPPVKRKPVTRKRKPVTRKPVKRKPVKRKPVTPKPKHRAKRRVSR